MAGGTEFVMRGAITVGHCRIRLFLRSCACGWLLGFGLCDAPAADTLEAVTFFVEPGAVYVPLAEAANELKWRIEVDDQGMMAVNRVALLPQGELRYLVDATPLIAIHALGRAGAKLETPAPNAVRVADGRRSFVAAPGVKRVEISLARQVLRAWQGSYLVLQTRISSGRNNSTPIGDFSAGPFRSRMHYSSLYQRAPMPWSVQIRGHVFVHGFSSVPDHPASHGCIRLPLTEGNPARFFFEWVDNGTPVKVTKD
jgi:hypothetical protein